jgi:hypothetical protein
VNSNVILTDVDGVLLNWEYAFDTWMQTHGHSKIEGGQFKYNIGKRYNISDAQGRQLIKYFNESAAIGFLPPLRDAMYYVKKLHEKHGFVFHAITSLSLDKNAIHLREMNLKKLFGETVFERIVCLDTGADKDDALLPYKDSGLYWVEDKIVNCETGTSLGLSSLLMEHGHNMDFEHPAIPRVKNWREVYDIVLGN